MPDTEVTYKYGVGWIASFFARGSLGDRRSQPEKWIQCVRMAFNYSSLTSQMSFFRCGYLVLVDSISLKASWGALGLASPVSCTVSANREVIPVWENSDTSSTFTLFAVVSLVFDRGPICYTRNDNWYLP